jgi:hypothetical protein
MNTGLVATRQEFPVTSVSIFKILDIYCFFPRSYPVREGILLCSEMRYNAMWYTFAKTHQRIALLPSSESIYRVENCPFLL